MRDSQIGTRRDDEQGTRGIRRDDEQREGNTGSRTCVHRGKVVTIAYAIVSPTKVVVGLSPP